MIDLMPAMEESFAPHLLKLMDDARENSNLAEFNDLVHQAAILAVMKVLSGNTVVALDQTHVLHWTCAFRIHALEESQEEVLAAIIQDEIDAASG